MPRLDQTHASQLLKRRHPEWAEFQKGWRFRADSLEGGVRYQRADYARDPIQLVLGADRTAGGLWPNAYPYPDYGQGVDPLTNQPNGPAYGQIVQRNLIPHLSETGPDGRDMYVLRLARTPVPNLVGRAIQTHIGKIFGKEITRTLPAKPGKGWLDDVDGRGSSLADWVQETAGPLFLVLGRLDVLVDTPPAPAGVAVETRADTERYRLDTPRLSVVLPEYLPWWRLDRDGSCYAEALVFDPFGADFLPGHGADGTGPLWWHWTAGDVQCYLPDGTNVPGLSRDHGYGRVPIARVFDRRLVRCRNVGVSRYETVAAAQRAVYNLESERYLSDVQQSHALLQGPSEYVENGKIATSGPSTVLPKLKNTGGATVTHEGWNFIDPPKGAQEALRQHVLDNRDEADRDAALAKPAGSTTAATVSQSGVSKIADQQDGNALLAAVAARLERLETAACEMAVTVATAGGPSGGVEIVYPRQFDLDTVGDVATTLGDVQRAAQSFGALPLTEAEYLKRLVSLSLAGLPRERLEALLDEVDGLAARAAAMAAEAGAEGDRAGVAAEIDATGSPDATPPAGGGAGPDPTPAPAAAAG